MQRPTSVTVFGALNISFGVLGLMGTAMSALVAVVTDPRVNWMAPPVNTPPVWALWTRVSIVASAVSVILLITSGTGLLKLRPWGRSLAIGYSVYAIVAGLVGFVMFFAFVARPQRGKALAP